MRSFMILIVAFAAVVSAVPFNWFGLGHRHATAHAHKHHARGAHHQDLTERGVSYDGSCGSWSGATCPPGFCCGPTGWCGSSAEHCGPACQLGFGQCGSGSSPEEDASTGLEASQTGGDSVTASSSSTAATFSPQRAQVGPATKPAGDNSKYGDHPPYGTPPVAPSPTDASTAEPQQTSPSPPQPQPSAPTYSPPASSPTYSPTTLTTTSSSYGSATPSPPSGDGQSQGGNYIKTYKGDGSTANGWPSQSEWLSFETLWEINQPIMKSSCSNAFGEVDNSQQELDDIKSSIEDISASTGIDKAFIYVVMQQESNGCVRVKTTANAHANPGLFQSHMGEGSCNDGNGIQIPCPKSEIHKMVEDGVAGTPSGDGLEQLLKKATGQDAQRFYQVARMYNSGSLDASGNLGLNGATNCYCSDIANRLTGWSAGVSKCDAGTVGA